MRHQRLKFRSEFRVVPGKAPKVYAGGFTNEFLTAARGMGMAKEDFAVLFKVLERMSGGSETA